MAEAVSYKGFEIYAGGFGSGERWQPTLAIGIAGNDESKDKQFWLKYPKQFYPSQKGAAEVALIAGKAVIDGKYPGATVKDIPRPGDEGGK